MSRAVARELVPVLCVAFALVAGSYVVAQLSPTAADAFVGGVVSGVLAVYVGALAPEVVR